ncbi:hypothetical protein M9H77_26579 [Catharanthus roseus]|uniref:Uncharacterized protein n=1 Tax=Catharanthus roseus TaxID=4058 RepID=A0ACC0AB23_CATRO|nr:hypothetical protein M9H77_26579 [Catharanthus roseus]
MDSPPSLSIESFSLSWLASVDKSLNTSFDGSDEASFIEMDPKLPPSRRFSRVPKDFSFDFRTSQPPLTLADAGELISHGILMPLSSGQQMKIPETYDEAVDSIPAAVRLISSISEKEVLRHSSNRVRCASLRRCKRFSKRIFQKYLDFMRPLCKKLRGNGSGSRVASISSARAYEEEDPATSPRTSVAWSADNWRRSCDSESSIYEAVLHCKRTNSK